MYPYPTQAQGSSTKQNGQLDLGISSVQLSSSTFIHSHCVVHFHSSFRLLGAHGRAPYGHAPLEDNVSHLLAHPPTNRDGRLALLADGLGQSKLSGAPPAVRNHSHTVNS